MQHFVDTPGRPAFSEKKQRKSGWEGLGIEEGEETGQDEEGRRRREGRGEGGRKDLNIFKFLQKDTIKLVFNI